MQFFCICVQFSLTAFVSCVYIQGTQIYDAKRGAMVDLGILDVMQIFGRAGRPQFDKYGEGTIITTHDKLSHYLTLLTQQNPIESQFLNSLADNLNAEVSLYTPCLGRTNINVLFLLLILNIAVLFFLFCKIKGNSEEGGHECASSCIILEGL